MRRGCLAAVALLVVSFGGCSILVPCLQDPFPAQEGMYNSAFERDAQNAMHRVIEAEFRYYGQNGRYGSWNEIGREMPPFVRGYDLTLVAKSEHFQLTATSVIKSPKLCCFLGMPRCRSYYTDETRVLRQNVHCGLATEHSPSIGSER